MELDDTMRHLVHSTSGVTGFVGPDAQPQPLTEQEVERLLSTSQKEAPRVRAAWEKGEIIRIVSEPFEGIHGRIEEVNLAKEKLKVLVSIFGRDTPVDLDFADVEKVE
jgi:transcriptional antiterminator NusG